MDIEKLLLKPNIDTLDSNTQRIRRNLVVTSIIGVFMAIGSVDFDNDSNRFAGFKFNDIEINHVYIIILLSLIYFLIHFVWASLDNLRENRLRLTGINVPKATVASYAASATFEPNTDEEKQSTMFSWWKGHRKQYEHLEKVINQINQNVKDEKYELAINTTKQQIEKLHEKSLYIEKALLRFEGNFWAHQKSQIYRWFILDFGVPCILACISFIVLSAKIVEYIC